MEIFVTLYEPAKVTSISDPELKGRIKCQFLRNGIITESWVILVTSVYSGADNGWSGQLAVNDNVILSFLDYPECQKPFVFGKPQSASQTIARADGTEALKVKDHLIEFTEDEIKISHAKNKSTIVFKTDSIEITSDGTSEYTVVRTETLKTWLENHIHLGNLGYPCTSTKESGYVWDPEISSDSIKIS